MEYIDPQQVAIRTIDKDLAVNAGAGTGKTKVLTERFIHILEHANLEEGKEIESIVAITFTKKATEEMVERIRKQIREKFNSDPKWRNYYRDMGKSNISTIHSFCGKILRDNPIDAKIDPKFEVLEDYTSFKLLNESIKETLENNLPNTQVYNLFRVLGANNTDFLIEDFYKVYNKIRTVGLTFNEVKVNTLENIQKLEIEEEDINIIKETFIYLMDNLTKRSKIYKLKTDDNWIRFNNDDYTKEELPEILTYLYENIGTSTKEPESIQLLNDTFQKTFMAVELNNLGFYNTILDLLIAIDINYDAKKKELRGLDYDDLQIKVLNLLENKNIREKYQRKYKYIMIDEFQDTNELQKKIFYSLVPLGQKTERTNLFIVGDPKQSIYGFRGADLDVFYDVMDDIKEISNGDIITLQRNYRTVNTVLAFINNVFSQLMKDKYSSLTEYNFSDNSIDVEILEQDNIEIPIGASKANYSRHYEANLIAKRIKELVSTKKYNYGDFAILFRAKTRNHIYEEALRNYGIPFYNLGGTRYFLQQEVLDLMNAIKSISNPFDAIATIGFLRSPLIGLSDISIYWILKHRENTVYNSMVQIANENILDPHEAEKLKDSILLFQDLFLVKDLYGLRELVDHIISKTFMIETLLLKQGGKQSIANVHKFKSIVIEYVENEKGTTEDFVDYLEQVKLRDESQGTVQSEDANVVKINTIHKSKGLQFPVVIIPEMSTASNSRHPNILFNKDFGIGVKLGNSRALYDNIRKGLEDKDKEERERVLYVAMTRAEKMLILGHVGRDSGFKQLIQNLIDPKQIKIISEINIEAEGYSSVRLIDNRLININTPTAASIPLLFEMPKYNEKTIERFNVSQYLTFKDCNRRFYLDHYKRISSTEINNYDFEQEYILSGIDKGNLIHSFCEHYRLDMEIIPLVKRITKSFGLPYNEKIYDELKPYIENYLKEYREDYDKVYFEKLFYLSFNNTYINGVIDRINIKDNKATIIDYKTNKLINKEELIEHYTPQLQLYAYIVKEILGTPIDKSRIHLLENGEFVDIPVDEEDLQTNLYNIEKFIEFVLNNNDINDYRKSDKCNIYCKHKSICEIE